jgi:hypothetical protein
MLEYPGLNDAEALALLGSIITWWSRVEQLMFQDMAEQRKRPEIASQKKFQRIEMKARDLIRQWTAVTLLDCDPSERRALEGIRQRLFDCAERRNELIHSFWDYPMPEPPTEFRLLLVKPTTDNLSYQVLSGTTTVARLREINREAAALYHIVLQVT